MLCLHQVSDHWQGDTCWGIPCYLFQCSGSAEADAKVPWRRHYCGRSLERRLRVLGQGGALAFASIGSDITGSASLGCDGVLSMKRRICRGVVHSALTKLNVTEHMRPAAPRNRSVFLVVSSVYMLLTCSCICMYTSAEHATCMWVVSVYHRWSSRRPGGTHHRHTAPHPARDHANMNSPRDCSTFHGPGSGLVPTSDQA